MLDSFMKQLTQDLELEESLATQVPGVYALPLEDDLKILLTPLGQTGITLSCDFATLTDGDYEELFKEALLANLFGQGTKGAIIGLNEEKKQLTLTRDITEDINYQRFSELLEDFMNTIDFWRAEYRNYIKGS